jgi:hypothetical protein
MGKTSIGFSATEFLRHGYLYHLLQNISRKFASEFENKVQWFGIKTLFPYADDKPVIAPGDKGLEYEACSHYYT